MVKRLGLCYLRRLRLLQVVWNLLAVSPYPLVWWFLGRGKEQKRFESVEMHNHLSLPLNSHYSILATLALQ